MEVLLSDASALLNLLATDRLAVIAEVSGWQFAICPAVRDEVKKLRDPRTGEMVAIDIAPLIDAGVLHVLEPAGDAELALYVEQAVAVDDGEAMSIAIAANRELALAIDDKQAVNHTRRTFPSLRLWSTPEILKHWAEAGKVGAGILREAIQLIEARARYFPYKLHPLAAMVAEDEAARESAGWSVASRRLAQPPVAARAAEVDGLVLQIVDGADVAHGAALRAHEDGMRDRLFADEPHAGQQRAVADAGGAEDASFRR